MLDTSGVTVPLSACTEAVEGSFQAKLYAVWSGSATVSYEVADIPSGATALPDAKQYAVGTENIAIEDGMTAPGYTFSGWTVKEAPEGFALNEGGTTFDMPNGNVVFEGSFTPKTYYVDYYRNANASDDTILRTAEFTIAQVTDGHIPLDKTAPTEAQTPAHYTFKHWCDAKLGNEVVSIDFARQVSAFGHRYS